MSFTDFVTPVPADWLNNVNFYVNNGYTIPEMFGAFGDGVHDDTVALNLFFASNPRWPRLSAKTYNVSGPLLIPQAIKLTGAGMGKSVIRCTANLSVPVITVPNSAAIGTSLTDFTVTASTTTSSGCNGIQVGGGQQFFLERLEVTNTFGGIAIPAGTAGACMRDCFVHNVTGIGYTTDAANMLISGCYAINCGSHGFNNTTLTGDSAGLTMSDCTAFNSGGHNFAFVGNSTNNIIDLVISNCVASASPNGNGYLFDTHGKYITCSNLFCELAGMTAGDVLVSNQDGINVTVNNENISLSNLYVIGSAVSGLHIDCNQFTVTGGQFVANNASANASGAGITVGVAGACTKWSITGVGTSPGTGVSNSQSYGINSFSSGNIGIVTGSILHGTTAAFQNAGGTATFANNLSV